MGPHGINRAVQRLEFCDCRKGLGTYLPPDLSVIDDILPRVSKLLLHVSASKVSQLTRAPLCTHRCEDNWRLQRVDRGRVRHLHQACGRRRAGSSGRSVDFWYFVFSVERQRQLLLLFYPPSHRSDRHSLFQVGLSQVT